MINAIREVIREIQNPYGSGRSAPPPNPELDRDRYAKHEPAEPFTALYGNFDDYDRKRMAASRATLLEDVRRNTMAEF